MGLPGVLEHEEAATRAIDDPLFKVLLHNDDHNQMDHVVRSLMKVFNFDERRAVEIMLETHNNGIGLCRIEPLEPAELHRDQLLSFGLSATVERDG